MRNIHEKRAQVILVTPGVLKAFERSEAGRELAAINWVEAWMKRVPGKVWKPAVQAEIDRIMAAGETPYYGTICAGVYKAQKDNERKQAS